jgi:hypothetical protein
LLQGCQQQQQQQLQQRQLLLHLLLLVLLLLLLKDPLHQHQFAAGTRLCQLQPW